MKIKELYPEVISEDIKYEYKAVLNQKEPVKWAKTLVAYANGDGGILLVGVSNDGMAFGLDLEEIDKTNNLIAVVNDRHIFPHVKVKYVMRSVDEQAERYVLAVKVFPSDSVVRYKDGDFNEIVYIKGDGNSTTATPEDIISLSKRKHGIDNETSEVIYAEDDWSGYIDMCKEYREDHSIPTEKELQNEEIVTEEGYAKSGFLMFKDDYSGEDTLICCRLWKSKDKTGVVLDSDRYKGSLAFGFKKAINFIERNTKTGWKKTESGGRKEVRSYPKEAIREALVNAIAHRDYSINGTQIDVDIYTDRIEIVSPGSWLLPKRYDEYPLGAIPSIRRNGIIVACLDVANLMERGGTGFQTIIDSYRDCEEKLQPVVSIYPGFLNLKLYDRLFDDSWLEKPDVEKNEVSSEEMSDKERVIRILKLEGPKPIKELQEVTKYKSRSQFLAKVLNPLIEEGQVWREGSIKSPSSLIKLK